MSDIINSIKHFNTLGKITNRNQIPGWFCFQELYDFAINNSQDGDLWLEIGSFLGSSTSYAAQLIKNSGKKITLYCVDPWKTETLDDQKLSNCLDGDFFPLFQKGLSDLGLLDYIIPIQKPARDAFDLLKNKKFKFICVDGLHDYDNVKFDISTFKPLLTNDGFMGGDDFKCANVQKAVEEEFGNNYITNSDRHNWPFWLAIPGKTPVNSNRY